MPRVRRTVQTAAPVTWRIALYIRLSREDWKEDDRASGKKSAAAAGRGNAGAGKEGAAADSKAATKIKGGNGMAEAAGETAAVSECKETAAVSRSIVEQKKILLEYVQTHFQEGYTVSYFIDDGLSGTDDARDHFQRMMEEVEAGNINCIIVKTLSRAFRNYADQGRYLEQIFPRKGVRFISTGNPYVDSFKDPDAIQNGMEIPINGLMNDRYAAKTSADIRRTFDAKRKRGEFIGAFAPYGYIKDPNDHNKLIIDQESSRIVKDIFFWFVNGGMSKTAIAKKLNELGVPNPTSYKSRVQHLKYKNPNTVKNDGLWCSSIILHILTNEVYIGNMVQGRHRMISYKVHTQVRVPEEEWFVVPSTHEAVIDKQMFAKAQTLHSRDTRTAPGRGEVYLFSGFLRCADCQKTMRRKASKNLVYYCCRTKTDKGFCSKHTIREDKLTQAVLDAVRLQISLAGPLRGVLDRLNQNPAGKTQAGRFQHMLKIREEERQKILIATESLYLDWKNGDITKDDYKRLKASFEEKAGRLRETINAIKEELNASEQAADDNTYRDAFVRHRNIQTLERGLIAQLIDMIYIHEEGQLTIRFTFADELKQAAGLMENTDAVS